MAQITVEQAARQLVGSLDTDAGFLLAAQWIDKRYQQLVTKVRPRHLRKLGEVVVPGRYSTGTVTVTQGSTTVTGDSTGWTSTLEGRYFRTGSNWYQIDTVGGATSLTLSSTYTEVDAGPGLSYDIVPRRVNLDADTRIVSSFVDHIQRLPLRHMSQEQLDLLQPGRPLVGSPPRIWAEIGVTANTPPTGDNRQVEFYPYPEEDYLLHYVYLAITPTLGITDYIPDFVDPYVLIEGAMVDAFRYEAWKAIRRGDANAYSAITLEVRRQVTEWEKLMIEAAYGERASDDSNFVLELVGPGTNLYREFGDSRVDLGVV